MSSTLDNCVTLNSLVPVLHRSLPTLQSYADKLEISYITIGKRKYYTQDSIDKLTSYVNSLSVFGSTIPFLCKEFNKSYNTIKHIFSILHITGKSVGHDIIYSAENVDELKKFILQHNDLSAYLHTDTCLKKYGVKHQSQSNEIKEKKVATSLSHFGVEHPMKNKIVLDKVSDTNTLKYGTSCSLNNETIHKKVEDTLVKKYGYKNVMYNSQIKEKLFHNNIDKYGNKCTLHSNKLNWIQDRIQSNKDSDFYNLQNIYGKLYTFLDIAQLYEKDLSTISLAVKTLNIVPIRSKYNNKCFITSEMLSKLDKYFSSTNNAVKSYEECTLSTFVKNIYRNTIFENYRSILSNSRELDIYIPDKAVAIEFDGLLWHSDLVISHFENRIPTREEREYYKNKQLEKTIECEKKGIRLIHFFEDEWINKQDICKSIIASSLGIYTNKVFARNCQVKEIPVDDYKVFLNDNHIQGYTKADIRLGLYYDNTLLQSIGIEKSNHSKNEIELNRMVTRLNTQVVGGFSRLMTHAKSMYNLSNIYSYVSRRMFDGKGYAKSGFTQVKINPPTYFYVDGKIARYPRYNFIRKRIHYLYNKGKLTYWNEHETEEINMYKNGYGRIWDCGTIKVLYI